MRKTKIKKLIEQVLNENNYDGRALVEINSTKEVELVVLEADANPEAYSSCDVDYDATDELLNRISNVLGWGGRRVGYGAWVLEEGYVVNDQDYCDPSNPIHY